MVGTRAGFIFECNDAKNIMQVENHCENGLIDLMKLLFGFSQAGRHRQYERSSSIQFSLICVAENMYGLVFGRDIVFSNCEFFMKLLLKLVYGFVKEMHIKFKHLIFLLFKKSKFFWKSVWNVSSIEYPIIVFIWSRERKGYHLNSVPKGFQTSCYSKCNINHDWW